MVELARKAWDIPERNIIILTRDDIMGVATTITTPKRVHDILTMEAPIHTNAHISFRKLRM